MNNKTKKEILSNCAIHKEISKIYIPDLSELCFEYLCDVSKYPLIKAIDMNDIPLLKYLISKKIGLGKIHKVRYSDKIKKRTALMYAAEKGRDTCVRLLMKTEELGIITNRGWTALLCAVDKNRTKCVELLANTKELEMRDKNGWTALSWADAVDSYESLDIITNIKNLKAGETRMFSLRKTINYRINQPTNKSTNQPVNQ